MDRRQMLWISLFNALAAVSCALGTTYSDWFLLTGALLAAVSAAWLWTEPER